eukprot:797657-Amorphochlora_amoeboformis.AAC.4
MPSICLDYKVTDLLLSLNIESNMHITGYWAPAYKNAHSASECAIIALSQIGISNPITQDKTLPEALSYSELDSGGYVQSIRERNFNCFKCAGGKVLPLYLVTPILTHTDKFIGVKISHTNNKSVAYANNLPVTVDQIRSGIFSKVRRVKGGECSDLRRRAKAAALKKQMDEFACDIIGNSKILTKSQIETILKSLPNSYRTRDWTQVYALQT